MNRIPQDVVAYQPVIKEIWDSFSPKLQEFWIETQSTLKNAVIIPAELSVNSNVYANVTFKALEAEAKELYQHDYLIKIGVNLHDAEEYDIAHELAHIYSWSKENYCCIYQEHISMDYKKSELVAMIFNTAIHSVVDNITIKKGFPLEGFFERKKDECISGILSMSNSDQNDYYRILNMIIDSKHRLPTEVYDELLDYVAKFEFKQMISLAETLPLYNFNNLDSNSIKEAFSQTCAMIEIDYEKLGIKLYNAQEMPLLK
ncbi:hypothetical protein [Dendrosporobacter sp. 1207_IL3150]|uniref:hypothetical protein n=1 Tax=Dendrosporobacter sp. 1207_IL3150 TaxID=3084054 RepID=UPI002FD9906D